MQLVGIIELQSLQEISVHVLSSLKQFFSFLFIITGKAFDQCHIGFSPSYPFLMGGLHYMDFIIITVTVVFIIVMTIIIIIIFFFFYKRSLTAGTKPKVVIFLFQKFSPFCFFFLAYNVVTPTLVWSYKYSI